MKLIDKYIIRSFAAPLIYCFSGFMLIIIIWDIFSHLEEFGDASTPFFQIVKYYVYLVPSVLIYIVPVSILLAVLYSLFQLTRNNELTAMRASGISLYRLVVPLMLMGLMISVGVLAINESVGPSAVYWTEQYMDEVKQGAAGKEVNVHLRRRLTLPNQHDRRDWLIGMFNTKTYDMTDVQLEQFRDDGTAAYKITAKTGEWVGDSWWFNDLTIQRFDQAGYPMGPASVEIMRQMTELNESPKDFLNETKDPEHMSALDLWTYIKRRPNLSKTSRAVYLTNLHSRLAMPWTCLVVAMIGIPFGTHTARKGALQGIVLCLCLFFAYYLFYNLWLNLGRNRTISAFAAGWFPNLLFFSIASVLIYRMR